MSYHYRFEQVMTIKEQEKAEIELAYKDSIREFEEVATQLYNALKRKEDLITHQEQQLKTGLAISQMHHYANFIQSTEKKIEDVQQKVMKARSKKDWFEQKLLDKTLECRKYEKMKEKDFQAYQKEEDRLEMIQLDELSQIAYYNKEIR